MDKDMLRGAFDTIAAAKVKTSQDVYDTEYKRMIGKGMSPKQAAAFAKNVAKRFSG